MVVIAEVTGSSVAAATLLGALVGAAGGLAVAILTARVLAARRVPAAAVPFGDQLRVLEHQLGDITDLVRDLERERARGFGALEQRLTQADHVARELAVATRSLSRTLTSRTARGAWGERLAADVLRAAGFVEGVHFHRQRQVTAGGIPDFTFPLPDGRSLHLDVKFPLDNYERAATAEDDGARERAIRAFTRDVRERVKEVARRGYVDPAGGTLSFALLFVPNEAVYGALHEHDPELLDAAMRQHVVLCSPLTLFAVLGVVRQATEAFTVQRRSDEVLQLLGRFRDQWDRFLAALDTLGARLESARRAYDDLQGPRRRQLERPLAALDELRDPVADERAS